MQNPVPLKLKSKKKENVLAKGDEVQIINKNHNSNSNTAKRHGQKGVIINIVSSISSTRYKHLCDVQFKDGEILVVFKDSLVKIKKEEPTSRITKSKNKVGIEAIDNEGSVFMVGDTVKKPKHNQILTIFSFYYNDTKEVIVVTNRFKININSLEHHIAEPEFILPELWHIKTNSKNYEILNKWFNIKYPSVKLIQDGHLMKDDEVMWRICNSTGMLFKDVEKVIFHQATGYNHKYISNENQHSKINLNPFAADHLHYFDKELAIEQLKKRKELTK